MYGCVGRQLTLMPLRLQQAPAPACERASVAAGMLSPRSLTVASTASAMGCRVPASTAAASCSNSSSLTPLQGHAWLWMLAVML